VAYHFRQDSLVLRRTPRRLTSTEAHRPSEDDHSKTVTEVKSGAGPLGAEGKDQFLAYVDMAEGRQRAAFKGKPRQVQAIKYVLTDTAGARKNLPWIVEILERRPVDFAIEVFDDAGRGHVLRSVDEIEVFLQGVPL